MPSKDEAALFYDIYAAIGRMLRFTAGLDKAAFLANDEKCYAVLAQLIIIGEAASRLADETREASPQVPWRQMIGTRNRVVHGYDAVDWDIVWDIVSIHGPALKIDIGKILGLE
jgi:uncharacterized protein with HEPN domain